MRLIMDRGAAGTLPGQIAMKDTFIVPARTDGRGVRPELCVEVAARQLY